MYISIAEDKEGAIRIYANHDKKLYCTVPLTLGSVSTYLTLIMEAIMSWTDPLKITSWEEVKTGEPNSPATARNAVGFNDAHREIWLIEYDDRGRSRKNHLLESGSRRIISTTFVTTLSKLFLTNLQSTLDQQKAVAYKDTSFYGKYKKKGSIQMIETMIVCLTVLAALLLTLRYFKSYRVERAEWLSSIRTELLDSVNERLSQQANYQKDLETVNSNQLKLAQEIDLPRPLF